MKTFTIKTTQGVDTVNADEIFYGQRVIEFRVKAEEDNSLIFTGDAKDKAIISYIYENVVSIKEESNA